MTIFTNAELVEFIAFLVALVMGTTAIVILMKTFRDIFYMIFFRK